MQPFAKNEFLSRRIFNGVSSKRDRTIKCHFLGVFLILMNLYATRSTFTVQFTYTIWRRKRITLRVLANTPNSDATVFFSSPHSALRLRFRHFIRSELKGSIEMVQSIDLLARSEHMTELVNVITYTGCPPSEITLRRADRSPNLRIGGVLLRISINRMMKFV